MTSPTAPLWITCDRRRLPRRILFRRRQQKLANPRALAQSSAMRRLFLIRHAKAELAVGRVDYERKLTGRGRDDAKRVAEALAARRMLPDVSSIPARRAPRRRLRFSPRRGEGRSRLKKRFRALRRMSRDAARPRARDRRRAQKRGPGRAQSRAWRTGDGVDRLRRRARTAPPGRKIPDRRGRGPGFLRPAMGGSRAQFGNAGALPHAGGTWGGPRLTLANPPILATTARASTCDRFELLGADLLPR